MNIAQGTAEEIHRLYQSKQPTVGELTCIIQESFKTLILHCDAHGITGQAGLRQRDPKTGIHNLVPLEAIIALNRIARTTTELKS